MSYVARYRHDIFLSYAHNDDIDWVRAFEESLRVELSKRLGHPVSIWQDENKLRVGHAWQKDIEEAIEGSAVFMTLISPSYRTSDWCSRERAHFVDQFSSIDDMAVRTKSGTAFRFLKVIKRPWEDDKHLGFFEEAQHIDFFRRDSGRGIDDELSPGSDDFRASVNKTAHSLASLLRAMRRMAETVFVATPASDVAPASQELRDELVAQGYDVQPDGPLDEFYSDANIRDLIEPSVLSVHMFGEQPSATSSRQLMLAHELEKRLVMCWFGEPAGMAKHEELAASLASEDGSRSPILLTGSSRRVIEDVLQLMAPPPFETDSSTPSSDKTSVYLICDPSVPRDSDFAAELAADLAANEGIQVRLPQLGSRAVSQGTAHERRLRECDGLLLYRDVAPLNWLIQNKHDVMLADRLERRPRPLRAKAFVVDDPQLLKGFPNVITKTAGFTLQDLEPFLSSLRAAGGSAAGA